LVLWLDVNKREGHMDSIINALESGKVKRFFRVRQKINAPGIISHITQRASGAERLFHEEDDCLEMLARLKRVSQTHELEFMAFVLMPNHVHLLLSQKKENLHKAMRELFLGYSRRYNKKYERKGHLFGGRYRQAVCFDEAYFLAVSLYIHLNPVRAGLVVQPTDYRWSSCRLYTEAPVTQSFVSPQEFLNCSQRIPKRLRVFIGRCWRKDGRLRQERRLRINALFMTYNGVCPTFSISLGNWLRFPKTKLLNIGMKQN
jgi:REP element-mobilizing transposase RayT